MFKKICVGMVFFVMMFGMLGCTEDDTQKKGENEQETIMERARADEPTYSPNNFLTRKYTNKWMKRMDQPSKLFYVYVLTDTGSPVGYFVAQYRPVSTATFLTPPKKRVHGTDGAVALPSPALDGTYYGEGGASQQYFWFDAETDAMIELKGLNYILSDQPISLDVPRIYIEEIQ